MKQYLAVKRAYPDAIVLFQLGDFYEMFFEDAVLGSRVLELTLTSRDKNQADPIPMCGVPQHAVKPYVRKLLDAGHKVAICDQVEDPKVAKGVVRREVTQLVTPGVVLDVDHLDAATNNYLAAVVADQEKFGIAALDLSTFELRLSEVTDLPAATDELARFGPKEILVDANLGEKMRTAIGLDAIVWHAPPSQCALDPEAARALLEEKGGASLNLLGVSSMPLAQQAGAMALAYAQMTQPTRTIPRCRVLPHSAEAHLQLDQAAIRNLELFSSLLEGKREGTLLSVIDETSTAMGGRMLKDWLARPLFSVDAISQRLDAVEQLVEQQDLRVQLRAQLKGIYDLERLTTRVALGLANPREVSRLGRSLRKIPAVFEVLREIEARERTRDKARTSDSGGVTQPQLLTVPDDNLADLADRIEKTLVEDPPMVVKEGGMIRRGVDNQLDQLIDLCEGGRSAILAIEARERDRTGISSLKVRYNKVFGYYIEITKSNLAQVPEEYHRKQTLVNAERFVTAELAEHEAKVLSAQERRYSLEIRLFEALRDSLAVEAERLSGIAQWVATIDTLAGLAEVAQQRDYVRPSVDNSLHVELTQSRHPVVECFLDPGQFVPNDVVIDADEGRMLIITGPNMAGKSTVMRQVALNVLLAQMGAFVPCKRARIGLVDRIFTRVGASDNLARGESTFMVEMKETAIITRHATKKSLVVLDEIGRGTATYDGISIAWAVAEHLYDAVQARTLFATHYHELCQLALSRPNIRNVNVAVKEWQDQVIFLYALAEGGASRSYGIEVARLAGLHPDLLNRARQVLHALEGKGEAEGLPCRTRRESDSEFDVAARTGNATGSAASHNESETLVGRLKQADVENLTPIEALNFVFELAQEARKLT